MSVPLHTHPRLFAMSAFLRFSWSSVPTSLKWRVAVGVPASTVAVAGVVLPFALGTAGLCFLFHVPLMPAVFAGAAMTAR